MEKKENFENCEKMEGRGKKGEGEKEISERERERSLKGGKKRTCKIYHKTGKTMTIRMTRILDTVCQQAWFWP